MPAPPPIASPCNGICQLDPVTQWCIGCGRTGAEIERWATAPNPEKTAILQTLPARMRHLATRGMD